MVFARVSSLALAWLQYTSALPRIPHPLDTRPNLLAVPAARVCMIEPEPKSEIPGQLDLSGPSKQTNFNGRDGKEMRDDSDGQNPPSERNSRYCAVNKPVSPGVLAVLNAGSRTPALVERRAPRTDGPLTHFASPRGVEKRAKASQHPLTVWKSSRNEVLSWAQCALELTKPRRSRKLRTPASPATRRE